MKTKQQTVRTIIRQAAIGVVFASSIIATVPAQAGWFSHARHAASHAVSTANSVVPHPSAAVHHAAATVHHTATATVGNIEATVRDISVKINTMFKNSQHGMALLGNIHDARLMDNLFDMLKFMRNARADYDDFAVSGSIQFRSDLLKIFSDLEQINETILHRPALKKKLDKAKTLVNKLPKTLLYPMYQAFGSQLQDMHGKLAMLQDKLQPYAKLPSMRDVLQDPDRYTEPFCAFHSDRKVKVGTAVIKVVLHQLSVVVGLIKDFVPRDLDVAAEALGEGAGGTFTSHPAYIIVSVEDFVINLVSEDIDDYETIAGALCD
jgi:hypothetical protein